MMYRYFYALIVALTLAAPAFAQDSPRKLWKDGPLTWEDFKLQDSFMKGGSELHYGLSYQTEKIKQQDTIFFRLVVTAYVDPTLSWVVVGQQTDHILRLHQLTFDIVERYRRQMQYAADRAGSSFEISSELQRLNQLSLQRIQKMRNDTEEGQDLRQVEAWEQSIEQELKALYADQLPLLQKRNFAFGMHVGTSVSTFTGSLSQTVKPAYSFAFGFDAGYKNSFLFLNYNMGGTGLKQAYTGEYTWEENKKLSFINIDVALGHPLLNNHKHRIIPYAGVGMNSFSTFVKNKEETSESIGVAGPVIGLRYDYKINNRMKLIPNVYGFRESTDLLLNSRLTLSRANFGSDMQGYVLSFTLSASFLGSTMKVIP